MVIGVVSFLLRKKMLFCKEKRTNEGVKEGKPSKTFWPSSWLGQILLVAEEILRSKYLHEMHLLWMEESPVNPISHWPLRKTLVPSHRRVLPCLHIFVIRGCDGTSVRQWGVRPRLWTGRVVHEQHGGMLQGKVRLYLSDVRWPWELHPSSCLPPSIARLPGIAAVPWGAVHSLPAAGSQEWLWLSLGGETGFFKRKWSRR